MYINAGVYEVKFEQSKVFQAYKIKYFACFEHSMSYFEWKFATFSIINSSFDGWASWKPLNEIQNLFNNFDFQQDICLAAATLFEFKNGTFFQLKKM